MKDLDDIAAVMADIGTRARAAAQDLAFAPADTKTLALTAAAEALWAARDEIKQANARDMD
ncbi:MAG: gamma-glutamyl-phosphate reductase, partial [Pseudomonadota bacterium]|nr:gamma-glutamyl-phosphate reductase [Pseudomonadota bacterium]